CRALRVVRLDRVPTSARRESQLSDRAESLARGPRVATFLSNIFSAEFSPPFSARLFSASLQRVLFAPLRLIQKIAQNNRVIPPRSGSRKNTAAPADTRCPCAFPRR